MVHARLLGSLNDVDTDVGFVDGHGRTNVEDGVDAIHCAGDICGNEEIADGGFEVFRLREIGDELLGGFVRVDKGPNGDFWIGKEDGDKMATLFPVRKGHKNDLGRHHRRPSSVTIASTKAGKS